MTCLLTGLGTLMIMNNAVRRFIHFNFLNGILCPFVAINNLQHLFPEIVLNSGLISPVQGVTVFPVRGCVC